MAQSRAVTVATTATRLDTAAQTAGGTAQSVSIHNAGAATVYIGGTDVTTANGTPVAAGEHYAIGDLGQSDGIYGIVASGTVECRVLEVGL